MMNKSFGSFFTSWNCYFTFLWVAAIVLVVYIIAGYVALSAAAENNPASGLAFVGMFTYIAILLLLIGFIVINYFVRKKIATNIKVSNRYLGISWVVIALSIAGFIGAIVISQINQSHYEKNIAPQLERCYQEYLAGNRSTPYNNCVKADN